MQSSRWLVLLLLGACSAGEPAAPIDSLRQRLAAGATLSVASADSAGAVTANRNMGDGWQPLLTRLVVEAGMLELSSDTDGVITVEQLAVDIAPIDIPASAIGDAFQLTDIRFNLARPVRIDAAWPDDNQANASFMVDLTLEWSLTRRGVRSRLGSPELPPVPVELVLTGDAGAVRAEVRALARGELWNWGDMIKLDDFDLRLAAETL